MSTIDINQKQQVNKKEYDTYKKILKPQVCYYQEQGESSPTPLRCGRVGDLIYKNQKSITTIFGKEEFEPEVIIYFDINNPYDSVLKIDIFNKTNEKFVKRFEIKQNENKYKFLKSNTNPSIQGLFNEFKTILESEADDNLLTLIKFIKGYDIPNELYKDIKYYEYG